MSESQPAPRISPGMSQQQFMDEMVVRICGDFAVVSNFSEHPKAAELFAPNDVVQKAVDVANYVWGVYLTTTPTPPAAEDQSP